MTSQASTEASFRISKVIAQKKKPYKDSEMIKVAFFEAAASLFSNRIGIKYFLRLNRFHFWLIHKTKIVNSIRAKPLQRRLFKAFADLDVEYRNLLLHSDMWCLSRDHVLSRFNNLLPAIIEIFKQQNE